MKKNLIIIISFVIIISLIIVYFLSGSRKSDSSQQGMSNSEVQNKKKERKILFYRSPMDPNQTSPTFRKDEMGMDYVPVYEDELSAEGLVSIDPAIVQNINVKTVIVQKRHLSPQVVTNGILTSNETNECIVTTKVNGWVDKLYVNYTGQRINKGDRLMDIYSPELVSAEEELITALNYKETTNNSSLDIVLKSGDELMKNAIRKLQLLDVPDKDIEKLKQTKEVKSDVTLYANYNGTVLEKNIIEGQKVVAGMPLLKIADLSDLWLIADVYEYELSKIYVGAPAEINYNFYPGKTYSGKISFIYPTLDQKSRTVKVRINVNNSNGELKPSMFANVTINGKEQNEYPVIPENSVIRSGKKDIVIISLGGGKFRPQEIKLGGYSEGYYQVVSGLEEGNVIVTSAQFLIDSESNLKAAVSQYQSTEGSPDSTGMKNMQMEKSGASKKSETKESNSSPLIRKGIIDLKKIDENKDGKVYEDIMDWNVISDKPGECPICGMTLKEFTLDQAKNNLIEHGFKVK